MFERSVAAFGRTLALVRGGEFDPPPLIGRTLASWATRPIEEAETLGRKLRYSHMGPKQIKGRSAAEADNASQRAAGRAGDGKDDGSVVHREYAAGTVGSTGVS